MNDDVQVSEDEARQGKFSSWWVIMARSSNDLEALRSAPGWQELGAAPGSRVWTDDFSNIVSILRFN
jgi:hypothetical protein